MTLRPRPGWCPRPTVAGAPRSLSPIGERASLLRSNPTGLGPTPKIRAMKIRSRVRATRVGATSNRPAKDVPTKDVPAKGWLRRSVEAIGAIAALLVSVTLWSGGAAAAAGARTGASSAGDAAPPTVIHLLRDAEGRAIPLITGLDQNQVVVLQAAGFSADRTGGVRQCVVGEPNRCGAAFPVRFDEAGAATVQYQLAMPLDDGGGCTGAPRCVLELFDGVGSAYADLSVGPAEPPDVRLRLPGGAHLVIGEPLEVVVDGTLPARPLTVVLCRRADPFPRFCTPLQDGEAIVPRTRPGPLRLKLIPSIGALSGCDQGCVLTVLAGRDQVRADAIEVRTSLDSPVHYQPARLGAGLAAAALLLGLGGWLWRRTDWSPPRAADGAAIDEAEFADLDAEAAAS